MTPQMLMQLLMNGQRGGAGTPAPGSPPPYRPVQFGRRAQQSAQAGLANMPQMQQMQQMQPQRPMQMMGRTPQAPRTIDPRLTGKTGLGDLLMGTGLGMMAQSDTPGQSFLGNMGRSLPMGMQMRDQARQDTALSDVLRGAPGSMQQLMKMAPQMAMGLNRDRDLHQVSSGAVLTDNYGNIVFDNTAEPEDEYERFGLDREAQTVAMFGQGKRFGDLTREEAMQVEQALAKRALDLETASEKTGRFDVGFNTLVQVSRDNLLDLGQAVRDSDQTMIDLAEYRDLEDKLDVEPFTGYFAGARTTAGKILSGLFGDDNDYAKRTALTERLNLLTTRQALSILGSFPGQLSEKELAVALFLAGEITFEETNLDSILDVIEFGNTALVKAHDDHYSNLTNAITTHANGDTTSAMMMLKPVRINWSEARDLMYEKRRRTNGEGSRTQNTNRLNAVIPPPTN